MIDLKFLKDNLPAVELNIRNRNMQADAALVARLYDERNAMIQDLDLLRTRRNENAARMKSKLDPEIRVALIEEGKRLKEKIAAEEEKLEIKEKALLAEAAKIPNMAHPAAPVGKEDKDNTEIKRVGKVPEFSFKPRDHVELGEKLDLIDFDTATKVSGTKFYYLKNEAVFLELALTR